MYSSRLPSGSSCCCSGPFDKDQDGRLDKDELRAAFQRAGLAVPLRRLDGFFSEIDMNCDGFITFDEWRYGSTPPHWE